MATINLKKGFDLNLKGKITDTAITDAAKVAECVVVPDDFTGIIPRLEKKEGEKVLAGEALYHDKSYESVKVTAPVSGTVKEIRRGDRRKIEAIVIESDGKCEQAKIGTDNVLEALCESGLLACVRQLPYDVVPDPAVRPRDIFVTCFNSAPLAASAKVLLDGSEKYLAKGVEALASLTDGKVYLSCREDFVVEAPKGETVVFAGPHPAGLAAVQANNIKPVNKGEVVWMLDVVTLARIGRLFTEGTVDFSTVVAVTGECVKDPKLLRTVMGAPIASLIDGNVDTNADIRVISGNALSGIAVGAEGVLRSPYNQITVIPDGGKTDEFMGWASLSPKKFSVYRTFTSWLCGGKAISVDARLNGGERGIVNAGEYDRMVPMDIYCEFLLKAIIAFDIEKMEQLGIYEVTPEVFALAEYADTSKLELQRIVRTGLDRLRAEMS